MELNAYSVTQFCVLIAHISYNGNFVVKNSALFIISYSTAKKKITDIVQHY